MNYGDRDRNLARQLAARPEPEGVTILDGHRRVGDAQRAAYLDHLSELQGRGYFHDSDEFEARQSAVQKAETEWDLNRLIADVPGLVEPTASSVKRAARSPVIAGKFLHDSMNRTWFRWVLHTLIAFAAVIIGIVPTAALGYWDSESAWSHAMVALFGIAGFILLVADIIAGCVWAGDGKRS